MAKQLVENLFCDGTGPHSTKEVRIYPSPGMDLILCKACFIREKDFCISKQKELKDKDNWPILEWDNAIVYKEK